MKTSEAAAIQNKFISDNKDSDAVRHLPFVNQTRTTSSGWQNDVPLLAMLVLAEDVSVEETDGERVFNYPAKTGDAITTALAPYGIEVYAENEWINKNSGRTDFYSSNFYPIRVFEKDGQVVKVETLNEPDINEAPVRVSARFSYPSAEKIVVEISADDFTILARYEEVETRGFSGFALHNSQGASLVVTESGGSPTEKFFWKGSRWPESRYNEFSEAGESPCDRMWREEREQKAHVAKESERLVSSF